MNKQCPNCGQLFNTDDLVRFEALGYFVTLKSNNVFAFKQPLVSAEYLRHKNCNAPRTGEIDGD